MSETEIQYVRGDVTRAQPTTRPKAVVLQCCNNRRRIGAGVSGAIIQAWPGVRHAYMQGSMQLGQVSMCAVRPNVLVCNIIGQDGYGRDGRVYVRYAALQEGMRTVALQCGADYEVHCPRLGCGLAGGEWPKVVALLQAEFCARGIPVTVWDL